MKPTYALAVAMLTLIAVHAPADAASIAGNGRSAAGSKADLVKSARIKKLTRVERQIARPNPGNLDGLKRKIRR